MSGRGQGGAREGAGRHKERADDLARRGVSSSTRIEARFEEEFDEVYDAFECVIPQQLADTWALLSKKQAAKAEGDYVCGLLAKAILAGEVAVPSPKHFREWARSILGTAEETEPEVAAPQPRSELSEKIAQLRRESDEREEERKANGTYRPLSSFRAVQNAAHYTRLGAA